MSLKIQMMTPEQSKERYKPSIWGPPIWFYLHSNAAKYPPCASLVRASRMKDLIVKIPGMVPCSVCKAHAAYYIRNTDLDDVCEGREKLFNWFVDFHNAVNARHNKRIVSYTEAKKLYEYT